MSQPERTCELYGIWARELWAHSRIRINGGETQIWIRGGFIPPSHDALVAIARQDGLGSQIWFGDHAAPVSERGIRVLGTPLGSDAFVRAQLKAIGESRELFSRIPAIQDLQSAWLLLLFCAATRATLYLRVCHPEHSVLLPTSMTLACGNVSTVFWASHSTLLFGKSAASHSIWAGWGCGTLLARSTRLVGAAGQIV